MAGNYCDNQHEAPAEFLVTNLGNGDTVGLCAACWLTWCAGLLQAVGYTVTAPAAEAAQGGQDAQGEGEAVPEPPTPKSGRSGRRGGAQRLDDGSAEEAEASEASALPSELVAPSSPFSEVEPADAG